MSNNLTSGAIFKAKQGFPCGWDSKEPIRKVWIEEGELCEFRYPHNAHFRMEAKDGTGKDIWLYLEEKKFLEMFEYAGKVFEQVRWNNRNSMKEIIECQLWEKVSK